MRAQAVATPLKGSERMNVTNYFKKHGFIFGLDMDTNPITVKLFSDMETAVNWSKSGNCIKFINAGGEEHWLQEKFVKICHSWLFYKSVFYGLKNGAPILMVMETKPKRK